MGVIYQPYRGVTALLLLIGALFTASAPSTTYALFETGYSRPLALPHNAAKMYALNTTDGYLEIFDVTVAGLTHISSVPFGLENIAVAARDEETRAVKPPLSFRQHRGRERHPAMDHA